MSTPSDQIPPSPETPPPVEPSNPGSSNVGSPNDDRNLAMITHLSGFLLSVIVPLVVWMINKDRSDKSYLVGESKEALNFQITILIAHVICWVLRIILIGYFLGWVVWIVNLIFCIVAAVKVSQNGSYRYPFALRLVR